jgi:hypothetical protein
MEQSSTFHLDTWDAVFTEINHFDPLRHVELGFSARAALDF